jgi:hypothetical protein
MDTLSKALYIIVETFSILFMSYPFWLLFAGMRQLGNQLLPEAFFFRFAVLFQGHQVKLSV